MNLVNAIVPKAAGLAFEAQKLRDYLGSSPDRLGRLTTIRSRVGDEYWYHVAPAPFDRLVK